MTTYETDGKESNESNDLNVRDVRALTEYFTVLEDQGRVRGAADLYLVVLASGSEYLVDAREGTGKCPDHEYRGVHCKHARRVEFATGPVPSRPASTASIQASVSTSQRVLAPSRLTVV